ncbi:hypothetical protein FACS1894181_07250 [Bacteroidia bacterium]|nr:hypothetical protein FACS1894181_07250 [Bacteroidia bacterium]
MAVKNCWTTNTCVSCSIAATLQRYHVAGLLPCKRFNQKTYYLESDVLKFINEHLQKPKGKPGNEDDNT